MAALLAAEGFALAAIAPAAPLGEARRAALGALEEGRLAGLGWMTEAWLERATEAATFLPGARSVVVVALPCHAPDPEIPAGEAGARGRIARYARGRDYHRVFERGLHRVARAIREATGAGARATVDYGPLLERPFARAAGLGWEGKSTQLLVPGIGPWTLLGAIATTLELPPGQPLAKSCGACTRCLDACPTGALLPGGHALDTRLCISYHTIENRCAIPRELRARFGDRVFGCDECLDSCPVGAGRFTSHPEFVPASVDAAFPPLAALLTLTEAGFRARFAGTAILRAKRDGLVRNACVAVGNVGTRSDLPSLAAALGDGSALVRAHAAWGLGRLAARLGLQAVALPLLDERLAIEHDGTVREELSLARAGLAESRPPPE